MKINGKPCHDSLGTAVKRFTASGILLFSSLTLCHHTMAAVSLKIDTVYGEDSRKEIFEITDNWILEAAQSVSAIVAKTDIKAFSTGQFLLSGATYGKENNLCPGEKYYHEPTPGFCTAFLVAPDVMATAGHCITSHRSCANARFVFGYEYDSPDASPLVHSAEDIYFCKNVILTEQHGKGPDFALVRLDRPVAGRKPLSLRVSGEITEGENLIVIGHPGGLPKKVATGVVRNADHGGYLLASLDVFEGNSGSPILNQQTRLVEGILTGGEEDYVQRGACFVEKHCEDAECQGEEITRISAVLKPLTRAK